jgi:hypothetical protein
MAKLVTDADIYAYLEIDAADDEGGNLLKLRDAVEDLLEHDTSQTFGPEEAVVDEAHDGLGNQTLYTRRPIKSLTSIKFRYIREGLQDQYFNLDLTDYVTFTVGKRRIRSQYQCFPEGYDNILVSYVAAANQPKIASQAVREVTAMLFRTRGSEDARSEQMGTFQHVMKRKIDESLLWQNAVASLAIPVLG